MKRLLSLVLIFTLVSCNQLQEVAQNLPDNTTGVSNTQISQGLKAALNKGIEQQVSKLAEENGFYNHEQFRIPLPEKLQKVEQGLRDVGLGSLADRGIKAMNHAAADAVGEATPIFVNAIKDMSVDDARSVLLGERDAATQYLQTNTSDQLYQKFQPVIGNSFQKVGAERIWSKIIDKYNSIPLTEKVNPDLTDYVTQQALNSVFKAIAQEEGQIRTDISERSSSLLRRVFALQD